MRIFASIKNPRRPPTQYTQFYIGPGYGKMRKYYFLGSCLTYQIIEINEKTVNSLIGTYIIFNKKERVWERFGSGDSMS